MKFMRGRVEGDDTYFTLEVPGSSGTYFSGGYYVRVFGFGIRGSVRDGRRTGG